KNQKPRNREWTPIDANYNTNYLYTIYHTTRRISVDSCPFVFIRGKNLFSEVPCRVCRPRRIQTNPNRPRTADATPSHRGSFAANRVGSARHRLPPLRRSVAPPHPSPFLFLFLFLAFAAALVREAQGAPLSKRRVRSGSTENGRRYTVHRATARLCRNRITVAASLPTVRAPPAIAPIFLFLNCSQQPHRAAGKSAIIRAIRG